MCIAAMALIAEILWLEGQLPTTSDSGQVLIGALLAAWAAVSWRALIKHRSWHIAVSAAVALALPVALVGALMLSCTIYSDCL